jgi:high-affinity iron transporter
MIPTMIIAFREFLEAFLITGIFLGVSRQLNLKKEFEIILAAAIGMTLSLSLAIGTYFFGDHARSILTEDNADFLESYLLIFSGIFIAYVVFSLHNMISRNKKTHIAQAHQKMQGKIFDLSLFFTIMLMVLREGFEIALFTASTSLFSAFLENVTGLLLGFATATAVGLTISFTYLNFPIKKVFRLTEYLIILLGASLVQNGITKLFETHFSIDLSDMLPLHMNFIPDEDSMVGHILQSFLGIDAELSGVRIAIMLAYMGIVYTIFMKSKPKVAKETIQQ